MNLVMPAAVVPSVSATPGVEENRSPSVRTIAVADSGRLRELDLGETDRNIAAAIHLSPLASLMLGPVALIAPLVLWLVRRERSPFNDDQGREVMNVILTGFLLSIVLLFIPILGWLALIIWYVAIGIAMIRGGVAASRGEFFRYPMTIRFLSSPGI